MSAVDKKHVGTLAESVLFASFGGAFGTSSRTRVIYDGHVENIEQTEELVHVPLNAIDQGMTPFQPPAVDSHNRSAWYLVPARGDRLMSPQLPFIPLAGAGSQVLPFLISFSPKVDPLNTSPSTISLGYFGMQSAAFIGLGAGAFVTTAAAGTLFLNKRAARVLECTGLRSKRTPEIDLEKGPAESTVEPTGSRGRGWKEFATDEEKVPNSAFEPLAPLVVPVQKEVDVTEARTTKTPLSPERLFPAPPQPSPMPSVPSQSPTPTGSPSAIPLLEGDISDTRDWGCGPVFPPGLDVAVAEPRAVAVLEPLDVDVSGIVSWPVLMPTPIEDLQAEIQAEPASERSEVVVEPVSTHEAAPTEPADSPAPCTEPLAEYMTTPAIQDAEELHDEVEDPFADPVDPFQDPHSESPLLAPADLPPAYTLHDTTILPGDSESVSDSLVQEPVELEQSNLSVDVAAPAPTDVSEAAAVPLPDSPPPSPRLPPSLLLIHDESLQAVATIQIIAETESHPDLEVPVDIPSTQLEPLQIPTPIVTHGISSLDSDETDVPSSPMSDSSSSSSSGYSSGPETPTELKQDLLLSSALCSPYRCSPAISIAGESPMAEDEEDMVVGEAVDVPNDEDETKAIVVEQAPDPPVPTIEPEAASPDWAFLSLPGSFDVVANKTAATETAVKRIRAADVPLLTADMVQLCRAMLAVSNCAGLVAQFFVGFSVWWSLALVPE